MSLLSAAPLGTVVHGLHHALLFGAAAAVPVLAAAPWLGARLSGPPTEEDQRIAALREAASRGSLGTGVLLEPPRAPESAPTYDRGAVLVPLAVVASAAAASVHGAATVTHVGHSALVGGFFVLSSLAQLGWALLALTGAGLRTWAGGAVLNAGVALVWLASRTTGLPFGLAAVTAPGPWDVAATAWELVVVGCCLVLLARRAPQRSRWVWSPASTAWALGCVAVLLALALTGPPA